MLRPLRAGIRFLINTSRFTSRITLHALRKSINDQQTTSQQLLQEPLFSLAVNLDLRAFVNLRLHRGLE